MIDFNEIDELKSFKDKLIMIKMTINKEFIILSEIDNE